MLGPAVATRDVSPTAAGRRTPLPGSPAATGRRSPTALSPTAIAEAKTLLDDSLGMTNVASRSSRRQESCLAPPLTKASPNSTGCATTLSNSAKKVPGFRRHAPKKVPRIV